MQNAPPPSSAALLLWDVFCRVIDNFGDIGVCWRLCADLATRGHTVRLWVNDASALQWMAPGACQGTWPGITVRPWEQSTDAAQLARLPRADVWVEGFGCELTTEFIAAYVYSTKARDTIDNRNPVWINLEYLSAEAYVERSHGLPSPVMHGPAKGWSKHFFYPGFTAATGGLLRESDLLARQHAFDLPGAKAHWLQGLGIDWAGARLVSLFCYEPTALEGLLQQLDSEPTQLLVTDGRANHAVQALLARRRVDGSPPWHKLQIHFLPRLTQHEYDHLLWACDLNCVRGEDSLVRALWAGKPLLWQIYPQDDDAHNAKLDAFLDLLAADDNLRGAHHAWNDTRPAPLPLMNLNSWSQTVQLARQRLLQMHDLTTQLGQFIAEKR